MSRERHPAMDWKEARAKLARAAAAADAALDADPDRARAILDERARLLARVPPTPPPGNRIRVATFSLANERYAIEARFVMKVVRLTQYEPVPGTPDYVLGISNLRGEILMIVDLRRFFGLAAPGLSDLSRLVVVGEERAEFGVLADEVHAVTDLPADDILPAPEAVRGIGREFLRGVTRDATIVLDAAVLLADRRLFIEEESNAHGPGA